MGENNKSYRIRTDIKKDKYLNVNLNQDFDELEILSLKINTDNFYRLHTSNYGCLVGRVLANSSVGIPNVKLSVFVPIDSIDREDPIMRYLYPYSNVKSKDNNGVRYNLLPSTIDEDCHQDIGTFPNKRLVLDDENVIEVFEKYFKFSTVTNAAGDYMIFGLPVGNNIIHCELDLSDIGMLSQKPRDLFYKGYNKTQFENSSQFKYDTNLDYLTQVISQDDSVFVYPFWGDSEVEAQSQQNGLDSQIKITRNDIDINYKFEPTCIFIGSLVADDKSNGFSKNCIPTESSGKMDRLTTGAGTIEMIRKTPDDRVESFSIQGNSLIDGNGTWCYQIPMNLDYMKTDEFGNFVPAENELTGIPTRTRVRFRISLADYESDSANAHLPKLLVPNNPTLEDFTEIDASGNTRGVDYNFGTNTREDSFRDLFWNNVYTVKQYIPRIQNIWNEGRHIDRNKNFSGIKAVNINGSNNPIPYNNLRVQLTFLFIFQCIIFKALVFIVKTLNNLVYFMKVMSSDKSFTYILLDGSMCPAMDGWYLAIGAKKTVDNYAKGLVDETCNAYEGKEISGGGKITDANSYATDAKSSDMKYNDNIFYTGDVIPPPNINISAEDDYFVKCVELQFAMEYEVIQFDFYNDWINGLVFLPRWFAELKRRKRVDYVVACNENFQHNRRLVQQCALSYNNAGTMYNTNNSFLVLDSSENGCGDLLKNKCHKQAGRKSVSIFGTNGGIIQTFKNIVDDRYVYYLRPSELYNSNKKINLFATDLVLLGSTEECNKYGLPTATGYPSSSFVMPPPTGELLDETQEMDIQGGEADSNYTGNAYYFKKYSKTLSDWGGNNNQGEAHLIEISGVDWGYNPFKKGTDDDTTLLINQAAGHFLEIGCTYSMTSQKSCINLSRICELGSEMAQSHYTLNGGMYTETTGVVSTREVVGEDVRMKFASLNSNNLQTVVDARTGYLMYDLVGYTPYAFDGSFNGYREIDKKAAGDVNFINGRGYKWDGSMQEPQENTQGKNFVKGLKEYQSKSYMEFRFNRLLPSAATTDFSSHYLINDNGKNSMPVFENSFYFYFGLKDGNTAIDRLYNEYFSECPSKHLVDLTKENGSTVQSNYLIMTNNSDNDITVGLNKISDVQTIKYSKNVKNWSGLTTTENITTNDENDQVIIKSGESLFLIGNINGDNNITNKYTHFTFSGSQGLILSGNINALWNYNTDLTEYNGDDTPLFNACGYKLFSGSTVITDISELSFPSKKFTKQNSGYISQSIEHCYEEMFNECTNLLTASITLPAEISGIFSYKAMFKNCINLINPPIIQARTINSYSCQEMFENCISLITTPELPATTIYGNGYAYMFNGCTSLINAPELPAINLYEGYNYLSMFSNCENLTTAPNILPASILRNSCYTGMFASCENLVTAPVLPATALTSSCYYYMFSDCTSLVTAPELPSTDLTNYCYGYMFYNCTSLNQITVGFSDWKSNLNATDNWVSGVQTTAGRFNCPYDLPILYDPSRIPQKWFVNVSQLPDDMFSIRNDGEYQVGVIIAPSSGQTIYYIDGDGNKQTITHDNPLSDGKINSGKTIYLYGVLISDNTPPDENNNGDVSRIALTSTRVDNPVSFHGNLNYLWNYQNKDENINHKYCGCDLFAGSTVTIDASDLILGTSSQTLSEGCYSAMFASCQNLISGPSILPATSLSGAAQCYTGMFMSCKNLENPPELPATTLSDSCYSQMFFGCKKLTIAPTLPATTLTNNCYAGMFWNCSELNSITVKFSNWYPDVSATTAWVMNVASEGTFKCPSGLQSLYGFSNIPNGWTRTNVNNTNISNPVRPTLPSGLTEVGEIIGGEIQP